MGASVSYIQSSFLETGRDWKSSFESCPFAISIDPKRTNQAEDGIVRSRRGRGDSEEAGIPRGHGPIGVDRERLRACRGDGRTAIHQARTGGLNAARSGPRARREV